MVCAPGSVSGAPAGDDVVDLKPVIRDTVPQHGPRPKKGLTVTSLTVFISDPPTFRATFVALYSSPTGGIPVVVPFVHGAAVLGTP